MSEAASNTSTELSNGEHDVESPKQTFRDSGDLAAIEADLAAVEVALSRLDAGTYWTDEVTGEPLPEHLLSADPLIRRSPN